jgi:hypothetical protein
VNEIRAFPPEIWGRIRVTGCDVVRHDRIAVATSVADEEGEMGANGAVSELVEPQRR